MKNEQAKTTRKIIYTDASYKDETSSISLYEKEIGTGIVIKVDNQDFTIENNTQAEALAVFNAILYIKKQDYKKSIILCDNENVAKKYANYEKGVRVIWVPREINVIADKLTKLENNTKEKEINLLKYLFLKIGKI